MRRTSGQRDTPNELLEGQALRSWFAADDPGELPISSTLTAAVVNAARSTRRRQRRGIAAGAAAAVLAVVTLPALVSLTAGPDQAVSVTSSPSSAGSTSAGPKPQVDPRAGAAAAASQFTLEFFTYDYRSLDRSFARVVDRSTGAFSTYYSAKAAHTKNLIRQAKVRATCTSSVTSVSVVGTDRALVNVAADQLVNSTVAKNVKNHFRLKLAMQHTAAGWLVADLTPVR